MQTSLVLLDSTDIGARCLPWLLCGLALLGTMASAGRAAEPAGELDRRLAQPPGAHPRLFVTADRMAAARQRIEADPLMRQLWVSIQRESDAMLDQPVSQREQVGRRLLTVSRTVLKRVGYLSLSYQITGDRRYLERARREMLAAAEFADWNPSHFLDVAEMTAALSIGYDWLHDNLDETARATIRSAIIDKGLRPGQRGGWWVTATNNWPQVCHAGLVMGALVVREHEPDLARSVIERALENIGRPMDAYGPNGGYPEGPGYWSYGTSFNVLLIDALSTALGSDFGLSGHERFMASASYYMHMHGPTLLQFNYSDNSSGTSVAPEMYWFAQALERPDLLWMEQRKLQRFVGNPRSSGPRLLPLLLLWAPAQAPANPPAALHYRNDGRTPVATLRSSWRPEAVYVGLKGGTPGAPHGQMDIGSFVMDADGVRWAIELDVQSYHSLESRGFSLWNMAQNSDRWRAFRFNNHSKNTLVVNGQHQRVGGNAPITAFEPGRDHPHTVIDMTAVYAGQFASALRGVRLLGDSGVLVQDEIRSGGEPAEVRWGMMTRAEVELVNPRHAILRQDGKLLHLRVLRPQEAQLELFETARPPAEFDAPNPGTRMVGFRISLQPDTASLLAVALQRPVEPDPNAAPPAPAVETMGEW